MSRAPSKNKNNIYMLSRLKASEFNKELKYRESAAAELGISQESLCGYENDSNEKYPPVEKVLLMSEKYRDNQLLNHYCSRECPIGKKVVQPIDAENIENMYRFAVLTNNDLNKSVEIQKTLLKIVEDGVIDESEKPELDTIIEFFKNLEKRSAELRILAEKHIK